jgi:acetolactate synthase-1/2/3 large subunit
MLKKKNNIQKKTIANFAVDLIFQMGSSTVFTLTGGMAMFINNAVAIHPRLKAVYCHHEQACVAAAEGYAKASNFTRAGFAVVTAGPGVSNTITSLISANIDSAPLIVLAGQIKSEDIDIYGTRTHGIQEINSKAIITPVVKRFTRLKKKNFKKELINTICEAFIGRPGPVFIEIPLDVQSVELEYKLDEIINLTKFIKSKVKRLNRNSLINKRKINKAIKELLNAKRPLLYIGNGCKIAGVEKDLIRFARNHKIPCVFSWISSDILSFKDDLNFGCPGGLAPIYANKILSKADAILFLGARLDLATTAFQRRDFGGQAKRIYVDVDKNELKKFEKFENSRVILFNLQEIKSSIGIYLKTRSKAKLDWVEYIRKEKKVYLIKEKIKMDDTKNLNVYQVAKILSKVSSNKIFVPCSSGYAIETFVRFFKPDTNAQLFLGAGLGSMGLGLPHAIGAACLTNTKKVICIEADGGMMLNVQELSTLKYLNPKNFVLIILNNKGYTSISASQKNHFRNIAGCNLDSGIYIPSYRKISKVFNFKYISILNRKMLYRLNKIITSCRKPLIVDINIIPEEYRGPRVKTILSKNGKIKSTSLNEIIW